MIKCISCLKQILSGLGIQQVQWSDMYRRVDESEGGCDRDFVGTSCVQRALSEGTGGGGDRD